MEKMDINSVEQLLPSRLNVDKKIRTLFLVVFLAACISSLLIHSASVFLGSAGYPLKHSFLWGS